MQKEANTNPHPSSSIRSTSQHSFSFASMQNMPCPSIVTRSRRLANDREFFHKHGVVAEAFSAKEHIIMLDSRINRADSEIEIRVGINFRLLRGIGTFPVRSEVQVYFVHTDGGTCDNVPPFRNNGKFRCIVCCKFGWRWFLYICCKWNIS